MSIEKEMQEAGLPAGYRYIWHALWLRHHLTIPGRVVSAIMREINPDGVQERKARCLRRRMYISFGPNFALAYRWYVFYFCGQSISIKIVYLSPSKVEKSKNKREQLAGSDD